MQSTDDKSVLVSVIIPFRNRFDYLKQAIKSAENQSHPNIEIVLVDDASTEEHDLHDYFQQFTYVRTDINRGPAWCRFKGLSRARGQYVVFLDSDDLLDVHFIRRLLPKLKDSPTCSFVYCYAKSFDKNGILGDREVPQQAWSTILPNLILSKRTWPTCGCLWRKSILERIPRFDGWVWEDYRMDAEAGLISNSIECVPEFLCFIRKHDGERASLHPDRILLKLESIRMIGNSIDRFYHGTDRLRMLKRLERYEIQQMLNLPDDQFNVTLHGFSGKSKLVQWLILVIRWTPFPGGKWWIYQGLKWVKLRERLLMKMHV